MKLNLNKNEIYDLRGIPQNKGEFDKLRAYYYNSDINPTNLLK